MATFYIDGGNTTGLASDSNPGTSPLAPKLTIASLIAAATITNGSTIYLAGKFRESATFTGKSSLNITQWPSGAMNEIRGGTLIPTWTGIGGGAYTANIGTGKNVAQIVVDYGVSVDSEGRKSGHMVQNATSAISAAATANNWFYVSVTGLVTANFNGTDPNTKTVEWCVGGVQGLEIDGDGHNITYVNTSLFCDKTKGGFGYGIKFTGNNVTVAQCRVDDSGYHSISPVSGSCTGNSILGCTMSGQAEGGILTVFHAASGNGGGGNVAANNTFYPHYLLGRDGQPLSDIPANYALGAGYSHVSVPATVNNGIIWRNNTIKMGFNLYGGDISSADNTAPADINNPATFTVRSIGNRWVGCTKLAFGGFVAHTQASIAIPNVSDNFNLWISIGSKIHFSGCDMDLNSLFPAIWVRDSAFLSMIGNTLRGHGTDLFQTGGSTGTISGFRGNLVTGFAALDGTNAITNCSANAYWNNVNVSADATATVLTANPFRAVATDGQLSLVGVKSRTTYRPSTSYVSYNGQPARGNPGAYQYGPKGPRSRPSSRRGLGPR